MQFHVSHISDMSVTSVTWVSPWH